MKFVKKIGDGEVTVKDNQLLSKSGEEISEDWAQDFHSASVSHGVQDLHSQSVSHGRMLPLFSDFLFPVLVYLSDF